MEKIEIRNFRSLRDVIIKPNNILALVGQNNSGKSNVLKALELFFKASKSMVTKDLFYMRDESLKMLISISFKDLTPWEKEKFSAWMCDEKLIVLREITLSDDAPTIDTYAFKKLPKYEWLQEEKINGNNITEWWENKDKLVIGSLDFSAEIGSSKPGVGHWKTKAVEFLENHSDEIPFEVEKIKNPKDYDRVLKGALPEFIYIPAVRDVTDEAKVGKSNPFGQLINSIFDKISEDSKEEISSQLKSVETQLSSSSDDSLDEIKEIENELNKIMSDFMDCKIDIKVSVPQLKDIFNKVEICADDGIRTNIDEKGHGMQRSMIFTILRAYAELSHLKKADDKAHERSTLFAIEEPELYLHPQSQRTLMSVLKEISDGNDQVVYSTHSNLFVDIAYFDDICIMRLDKEEGNHQSYPTQLTVSALIDDLKARKGVIGTEEGMRELHFHAFNEMINEGFFASKVIIVEGDSEKYAFPIYADAYGYNFDRNNIAIVHSHGKGSMDRLYRIFNGLGIPTYLIFDGDKNNIDKEIKEKTRELLDLLGSSITDMSDLETTVSHNYAVFEEFLEKTLENEIDEYNNLCNEAGKRIKPMEKPLRNKFIANELMRKINNGESKVDFLPNTIIEIIDQIKEVTYEGCILQKCEEDV
jgi:predicted ATP-dependent endonuclease of OLD family